MNKFDQLYLQCEKRLEKLEQALRSPNTEEGDGTKSDETLLLSLLNNKLTDTQLSEQDEIAVEEMIQRVNQVPVEFSDGSDDPIVEDLLKRVWR